MVPPPLPCDAPPPPHLHMQAKQQAHLRTHIAEECKNEYASQLQKFNKEQNQFYYSSIPQVFNVSSPALLCQDTPPRLRRRVSLVPEGP